MIQLTRVAVRFVGTLRWALEKDRMDVEISDPTNVKELIETVILKMDKLKTIDAMTPLSSTPNTIILVNETEIGLLKGLLTPLAEGDVVTLIPTAHGG